MLYDNPEDARFWANRDLNDTRHDWGDKAPTWIDGYWESIHHPHRRLIVDELNKLEFDSLLELGCNIGPNLAYILEQCDDKEGLTLEGIDVNPWAIEAAQKRLPSVKIKLGDVSKLLPYFNKEFDVVLADAVLMYIGPDKIHAVVDEINRIAKKAVILCEWDSESEKGVVKDFHWARNYAKLFTDKGFNVDKIKITKDFWPNKKWSTHGFIYVCRRP